MPSAELVKRIEMEIGEVKDEMRLLESVQAILTGRANGAGPETQPAGPRKPGRPRKTTRRRTTAGTRTRATTRKTGKPAAGRRKATATTRRRREPVAAS